MANIDRHGLPISAPEEAIERYERALAQMFAMQPGVAALLDEALSIAPDFALAHAARARALQGAADPAGARAEIRLAAEAAEDATPRERAHVEVLQLAIDGRSVEALAAVRRHAETFPTDALPLSLALGVYGLLGFSGRVDHHAAQLELLDGIASAWPEDGWFLAAHGWVKVECGMWDEGAALLDRALQLTPDSAHAAHGRAHAYYEAGQAEAGREFVASWLAEYDPAAPLHCHLAWHEALFALQLGDIDAAVRGYERWVRPGASQAVPMFTMIDAAALAWRLGLAGAPLPAERREALAAFAFEHFPAAGVGFVNVHNAMALSLGGATDALTRLGQGVAQLQREGRPAAATVAQLVDAVRLFGAARYADAAVQLEAVAAKQACIGGSHAQRDVLTDTLISAYLRDGRGAAAENLVQSRAARRAAHLDRAWLTRVAV